MLPTISWKHFFLNILLVLNRGFVKNIFNGVIVEVFYLALIGNNGKIIACHKIAEGNAVEINMTPRKVANLVMKSNVHNVIIAHNHPRGPATPSKADDAFTEGLALSLAVAEAKLLDHIIIGEKGDYYSYKQNAQIEKFLETAKKMFQAKGVSQYFTSYDD